MWTQIRRKYNNQSDPPPIPTTRSGVVCAARTDGSLQSKWKRVATLTSYWTRCISFAERNPKSGEDAASVITRAQVLFLRNPLHKHAFPYLTTYELIKEQPKWLLEHKKIMEDVAKVARAAKESVPMQLARVVDATVASTKKPEGVNKSKKSRTELGSKKEEEKMVEEHMETWLDNFTRRKELAKIVLAAANRRSRADQETANDAIVDKDVTGMSDERRQ